MQDDSKHNADYYYEDNTAWKHFQGYVKLSYRCGQ